MKVASFIFSWLGGIVNSIIGLISLDYFGFGKIWFWNWVVWIIIRIIILGCRENAVTNGKKVAVGVLTLLFVSIIGGILTLSIPEKELNGNNSNNQTYRGRYNGQAAAPSIYNKNPIYVNSNFTEQQKIVLIQKYKQLLDEGIITKKEFESKKKEILQL